MSLPFLLLFFGPAHLFALLSKNLQSVVNKNLVPSDLVKVKAVDPNWRAEEIICAQRLFVHRETNEFFLETNEKLWTHSDIIGKFEYRPDEFKNLLETRDWNRLFLRYLPTDQFKKFWREALAELVDINEYEDGETVEIISEAMHHDFNIVKTLLERGAKVNAKDTNGWTALHHSAYYTRIQEMKLLLKSGAEINATDNMEQTPLMFAVRRTGCKSENIWSLDAVNVLLKHGARWDMKNKQGRTALHLAAYYGSIEAIEVLLKFEAEINATDNSEQTPLMLAVKKLNVDAVQVLLKHGARLDMKNEHEKTALDIARDPRDVNHIDIRSEKIIKLLEPQQNQIPLEKKNEKSDCEKYLII